MGARKMLAGFTVVAVTVSVLTVMTGGSVEAARGGCKAPGKHCSRSEQCCAGLACGADGSCQQSPGEIDCTSSSDCPSGQMCSDGACCFGVDRSCTESAACCAPAVCNKLPGQVSGSCCVPPGGACASNFECCSNTCDTSTGCF